MTDPANVNYDFDTEEAPVRKPADPAHPEVILDFDVESLEQKIEAVVADAVQQTTEIVGNFRKENGFEDDGDIFGGNTESEILDGIVGDEVSDDRILAALRMRDIDRVCELEKTSCELIANRHEELRRLDRFRLLCQLVIQGG